MTLFKNISCLQVFVSVLCTLLLFGTSHQANIPAIVTTTRVTNFEFFNQVANPCEVTIVPFVSQNEGQQSVAFIPTTTTTTEISSTDNSNVPTIEFFRVMANALLITLGELRRLESADLDLPECNGISLDSLPITPPMDNMNEGETAKQAYKTVIFLTSHFYLMSLDRQMTIDGENVIIADENAEPERTLPSWRFQRCGNETESFQTILLDVTMSLEGILCNILSSASDEQTSSFREPLNALQRTTMYRYHAACSTLQTRDCLVVREAKHGIAMLSRKYAQLMQQNNNNYYGETNGLTNGTRNDIYDDNLINNTI